MRKKLTLYGSVVIGFVAAIVWFYCGPVGMGGGLSMYDVLGIRRAIRQETWEPILNIRGESPGVATVQTGRAGNGLDGSGHFYYLNEGANRWHIVDKETWMSSWPNKPHGAKPAIGSVFHVKRQWREVHEPQPRWVGVCFDVRLPRVGADANPGLWGATPLVLK